MEGATETLSEYLERDITSENLADIKQKVQDKYRFVRIHNFSLISSSFYPCQQNSNKENNLTRLNEV